MRTFYFLKKVKVSVTHLSGRCSDLFFLFIYLPYVRKYNDHEVKKPSSEPIIKMSFKARALLFLPTNQQLYFPYSASLTEYEGKNYLKITCQSTLVASLYSVQLAPLLMQTCLPVCLSNYVSIMSVLLYLSHLKR